MAIDKTLQDAVAEGDINHIKNALTLITRSDRGFNTGAFDEALRYVEQRIDVDKLYEPFDGEAPKPESEWDKDYWAYVNASLMDNFCRERIDLLKKIGNKIYPAPVAPPTPAPSAQKKTPPLPSSNQRPTPPRTPGGSSTSSIPKWAPAAVVALLIIAAVVLWASR